MVDLRTGHLVYNCDTEQPGIVILVHTTRGVVSVFVLDGEEGVTVMWERSDLIRVADLWEMCALLYPESRPRVNEVVCGIPLTGGRTLNIVSKFPV